MATSEARIKANQANALRSTGPSSPEGKRVSRSNACRHFLTATTVLDDEDAIEVERRAEALQREMAPKTELGAILVRKIAVTSVLSERAIRHEFIASAGRVRNAPDRFDAERIAEAETRFEGLGEDPRGHLRKLRAMPEGVELLVGAWLDLKAELTRPERPRWTAAELVKAANLMGVREEDARGSKVGVMTREFWGDFGDQEDEEDQARQASARARIVELIDEAVAELKAHAATLDLDRIALDRAEAGGRALFDASKEATLARRYESEMSRGFYKAIKEFREVEAEAASRPTPPPAPELPPAPSSLGSFRDEDEAGEADSADPILDPHWQVRLEAMKRVQPAKDADGNPIEWLPKPRTSV